MKRENIFACNMLPQAKYLIKAYTVSFFSTLLNTLVNLEQSV